MLISRFWACGVALATVVGAGSIANAITLLPTANLVGRYEASSFSGSYSNGQTITTPWTDSSVNNNHANPQGTPQFSTALGVPTVRFVQSDNESFGATGGPGIGATSGFTYWGVVRSDSFSQGGTADGDASYLWDRTVGGNPLVSLKASPGGVYGFQKRLDGGGGLGGPVGTTPISGSALQIVTLRRNPDADQFEIWVNGVLEGTVAVGDGDTLTPDPILIGNGNGGGRGFTGDFADILIFNSQLSAEDFNAVGAHLSQLYGIDTAFAVVPEPATLVLWSTLGLGMIGVVVW